MWWSIFISVWNYFLWLIKKYFFTGSHMECYDELIRMISFLFKFKIRQITKLFSCRKLDLTHLKSDVNFKLGIHRESYWWTVRVKGKKMFDWTIFCHTPGSNLLELWITFSSQSSRPQGTPLNPWNSSPHRVSNLSCLAVCWTNLVLSQNL